MRASSLVELSNRSIASDTERHQLLVEWNNTYADYSKDKCIHELFEVQARDNPDVIALVFEGQQLSYSELNTQANQLAHYLVNEKAIKPDTLVGICIERSLEMIIAILGILKAGGAYVPLDPDYPRARLAYILGDANLTTVITQRHLLERTPVTQTQALCLDDIAIQKQLAQQSIHNINPQQVGLTSKNLAYVIYTSGSTGNPKGSLLEHTSLCNLVFAQQQGFGVNSSSRVLQFASLAFDAAISELAVTLCAGARLILVSGSTIKNIPLLETSVQKEGVTHATLPPALLPLLTQDAWQNVTTLVIAGDACTVSVANQWALNRHLINAYGPSEATVCSTMGAYQFGQSHFHIGKPLQNIQVYILDENGELASRGATGELCIGGVGLSRGYLNRAELTAEKFIPNSFYDKTNPSSSERLYKTGDLVRWLPDGNLEFLGRIDHQVKIRGFRIELGEIENTLSSHEFVKDALVLAKVSASADKSLVAYLVIDHDHIQVDAKKTSSNIIELLRQHLNETLPDYMVPSAFVFLEQFPLTPNGKVDRKVLPEPDMSGQQQDYVAPQTEMESFLCKVWQEILEVKRVGVTDNFFLLGGDSLKVIKLLGKMQDLGIDILAKELMQFSSIVEILAFVNNKNPITHYKYKHGDKIYSLPNRQLLFKTAYNNQWNIDGIVNIDRVDILLLEQALRRVLSDHQGLRHLFYVENDVVGEKIVDAMPEQLLEVIDLSLLSSQRNRSKEIEKISSQSQSKLDLTKKMYKFFLFLCGNDEPARFVWIIHHALMDGYGADIFSQELFIRYLSSVKKIDCQLPAKTTSVIEWGNYLYHYINSDQAKEDVDYWTSLDLNCVRLLMDYPEGLEKNRSKDKNLYGNHVMVVGKLGFNDTALLQQDKWKYNDITAADIILSAFSSAISIVTKSDSVYFDVLSHGRHKVVRGVDLSRTVGWLMDNVPVCIHVIKSLDAYETVRSFQQQFNQIPSFGLGFNGLKYLHNNENVRAALESIPIAEFSINYVPAVISAQRNHYFGNENVSELSSSLISPGTEDLGIPYCVEDKEILWPTHIQIEMKEGQYNFMWFTRDNLYKKPTVELAMSVWIEQIEKTLKSVSV